MSNKLKLEKESKERKKKKKNRDTLTFILLTKRISLEPCLWIVYLFICFFFYFLKNRMKIYY